MAPSRILVVDDDAAVLDVLRLALASGGHDVLAAGSAMEGLVRAQGERPDLVLLDILMPEMDGWELLKLLRLDPATRDMPVVIVSARSEPRDRVRGLQEGAVDYLTKPFSVAELLAAVDTALARAGREVSEA
jgi:DNA-binding response OmpR family regulator